MVGKKEGKRTRCLEKEERERQLEPCPGALSQHERGTALFPSGKQDVLSAWCSNSRFSLLAVESARTALGASPELASSGEPAKTPWCSQHGSSSYLLWPHSVSHWVS